MSTQFQHKIRRLLDKFRSGNISVAEFQALKENIKDIPDKELKQLLDEEWESFEGYSELSDAKKIQLYRGMNIRAEVLKPRFSIKKYWMQIAASLLLFIVSGLGVLTYLQRNEINALAEQNVVIRSGEYGQSLVTLPDGSTVHLNAKSALTYSQSFGRNDRRVFLIGEGFFEVKKDSDKRFTVSTGYMDINVLGTKFNVYAYETKDIVEMSLVEGNVHITTDRPPYHSVYVKPHEKVTYHKQTGKLVHEGTNNQVETAWMNKELVFRSERLSDVFRCLSRKFAVTFIVEDKKLLEDIYTGTFEDENIESVMHVLTQHYHFDYVIKESEVYIRTQK